MMLKALVQFSLRFRGVVVSLAFVLVIYGSYVAKNAKLDVFPNFVQPQVVIQTEAPGLAPEHVEMLVTLPVETAVNGLGNMESLRSESIQGLSIVTAVFKEGTDVFIARQMLVEKIGELAGKLPVGVHSPRLTPLTSSTMDLLKIGLVSDRLSSMELRAFADWTIKPRLLAVPGVAKCSSFGGDVRQLQIQVLPERLQQFDLSIADVLSAARMATGVMGAGFLETKNQRIVLQTQGQMLTPSDLGEVVVVHRGIQNVRLKDVATVTEGAELKFGETLIQGRPGVLLTMSSQYGANTMEVTEALEAALEDIKPTMEKMGIELFPRLHRPATFIETSLHNIKGSLYLGGALVAVVLFLFLGHFRTAFISVTAIPISLLTAIVLLEKFGVSLNTITLGGLAIAIGEVVDDAIIDVENIFRRLRENKVSAKPRPIFGVILEASLEVRTAVVYATFIVALVFVPVLTLTGLQGKFFAPLALSYILAILASLIVALTLTPALAYFLFSQGVREERETRLQRFLKNTYTKVLRGLARFPGPTLVVVALICGSALFWWPKVGGEFLPEFREGHFVLQVSAAPGTSLPEMLRVGKNISDQLLQIKSIATVEQQIGRAELGEDPWGPHRSEFHVELRRVDSEEEERTAQQIRKTLSEVPGIQFEVLTFLGDRIGETISGETAPVVVSVFGDDLDLLDEKAKEISTALARVKGAQDVQVKSPPGQPRIAIRLRPEAVNRFGFRPVEILETIQTAYQGTVVAQTFHDNRFTDVAVMLNDNDRGNPDRLGALMLRNGEGVRIPLSAVADIFFTSGRHSILHEGARRRQTITCNPQGVDLSAFVEHAKTEVAKIKLPIGSYVEFGGEAEANAVAQRQLLFHSGMVAVGIVMLLSIVFGSWRNLLLVLCNLPFALVGGVIAVYFTTLFGDPGEGGLTIGSLVGFVTLFGISIRNSIMMISHYEHLIAVEGAVWGMETALRGASERLIPILMTALVTSLGLLPLAIGAGEAGREIEGPMAIVILGGLITSTALNLLVLPTLALRFGLFRAKQEHP